MKWGDAHISHGSRAGGSRGMFLLVVLVLCVFPQRLPAQDTVNRDEPDFVKVSLLLTEPGGALYSRFGHACLRMQCPTFDMDFAFTYESEDASSRVLRFMAGKLKMGLFGIPTQDYINSYAEENRGVKEYPIDMPIAAKRNLWRVLDSYTSDGINIPYNYITRGCAYSTLRFIREGLDTIPIEFGLWPEKYEKLTRREISDLRIKDSPWCRAFMHLICNGAIDKECANVDKVIMPYDLLEVLQGAKVQGYPLLTGECITLLPDGPGLHAPWFTPLMASLLLLALTLAAAFLRWRWMDYVLLALQTLLGVATLYLVCFSSLCCTEWSWLIIPFNPLPLIFWKWRRHWALPLAIVLAAWCAVVAAWPHHLTDPCYIILTLSLITNYMATYMETKQINSKINKSQKVTK